MMLFLGIFLIDVAVFILGIGLGAVLQENGYFD
jgi:hypothetical protein